MRQTHNVQPNTPEWEALRLTFDGTASEAPIMMGVSSHTTRDAFIAQKATGIIPEVDPMTQRRFDEGHRNERLARTLAEKMLGEELYPTTVSDVFGGLHLGASLDGEMVSGEIIWEHKQLNKNLAIIVPKGNLDIEYKIQMEQQLMISRAEKCLFMASKDGDEDTMVRMWYYPDKKLQAEIIAGWIQFWIDVKDYKPKIEVIEPVPKSVTYLPAVSVSVSGDIAIIDNFELFEKALHNFVDNQLIKDPETDQDFVDLDAQIKVLKEAEAALNAAEAATLSKIETIEQMQRTKKTLLTLAKDNRLMAEKLSKAKKLERKTEILDQANQAVTNFIISVNDDLGGRYLPYISCDFVGVMKGRSKISSLISAANDELARTKIYINEIAVKIRANLKTYAKEGAQEYEFLFRDLVDLLHKDTEDFLLLIKFRIDSHKKDQAQRLEAERERIREEERAKADSAREAIAQAERDRFKAVQDKQDSDEREVIRLKAKAEADKEAAIQAERDRVAAKEAADLCRLEAEAAAKKEKAENKDHQENINHEAVESIMALGFAKAQGENLITAIALNKIKHIFINY